MKKFLVCAVLALVCLVGLATAQKLPESGSVEIEFALGDSTRPIISSAKQATIDLLVKEQTPCWVVGGYSSEPFKEVTVPESDQKNNELGNGRARKALTLVPHATLIPLPREMGRKAGIYWPRNPYGAGGVFYRKVPLADTALALREADKKILREMGLISDDMLRRNEKTQADVDSVGADLAKLKKAIADKDSVDQAWLSSVLGDIGDRLTALEKKSAWSFVPPMTIFGGWAYEISPPNIGGVRYHQEESEFGIEGKNVRIYSGSQAFATTEVLIRPYHVTVAKIAKRPFISVSPLVFMTDDSVALHIWKGGSAINKLYPKYGIGASLLLEYKKSWFRMDYHGWTSDKWLAKRIPKMNMRRKAEFYVGSELPAKFLLYATAVYDWEYRDFKYGIDVPDWKAFVGRTILRGNEKVPIDLRLFAGAGQQVYHGRDRNTAFMIRSEIKIK